MNPIIVSVDPPLPPLNSVRTGARLFATSACAALLGLTLPATAAPGDVEAGFDPNANGRVTSMAVQTDGKILLGGDFTAIGGVTRNHIARLNADGTLDTAFNPNAMGGYGNLWCMTVQSDGKILVGGSFTTIGGLSRDGIARLYPDGTVDTGFNLNAPNASIRSMILQADGKLVIADGFSSVGGVTRNRISRLHANGSLDTSFSSNPDSNVWSAAMQPDGKIIIGGDFTKVGGVTRNRIARLNANGSLDTGFDPNSNSEVVCTAVQPDGKILIGGWFSTMRGTTRRGIARVLADGTLDTGFNSNFGGGAIYSIAMQADGRIILGGFFGTAPLNNIARVNGAGALDTSFKSSRGRTIYSMALQADGKIVVGGDLSSVGGVTRNFIARIENDPATQSLTTVSTTGVQWMRGGASPEIAQVSFEVSSDGSVWSPLGAGVRVAGGWELNGLNLPERGLLRARGRTTGGVYDGSSWPVETVAVFPGVIEPEFQITNATVEANNFLISFPSETWRTYTLWQSDTMTEGAWTNTGLPVMTGTGGTLTFTLPVPASGRLFVRVHSGP